MVKRFLATSLIGVTLAGAAVAAVATTTTAAAGAANCPAGSWDGSTLGTPTGVHAGMTGAALWRASNNNVFSLRVSHTPGHAVLYTGAISTDGALVYVPRHLERGDVIHRVSSHTIVFAMTNIGHLDGLDFAPLCASKVTIGLALNRSKLPTNEVVIGSSDSHPASNPFTETKH
jgi:hypothetical protein